MGGTWANFDEIPPFVLTDGVTARPLFGTNVMFNLAVLEPGSVVAPHSHPHEQLGLVLRGTVEFEMAGERRTLGPMDAVAIPGGVEHSAVAGPEGTTILDAFAPVRAEYRAKAG